MKKVRIAVVGPGNVFTGLHLPVLRALDDRIEIAAVSDIKAKAARRAGELLRVPWYTDASRMLDEVPGIDMLYVTSQFYSHHIYVLMALERGIHAFVEKPFVISLPIADEIINRARKRGLHVGVAENFPFFPNDQLADRIIRSGLIGRVKSVLVIDPVNPFSLDIGVHRISQFRRASGGAKPVMVTALVEQMFQKEPKAASYRVTRRTRALCDMLLHCRASAQVRFDNGARGLLEFMAIWDRHNYGDVRPRETSGTKGRIVDHIWPCLTYPPACRPHNLELELGRAPCYEAVRVERVMRRIDGARTSKKMFEGITRPVRSASNTRTLDRIVVRTSPPLEWKNPFSGLPFGDWQIATATQVVAMVEAVRGSGLPSYTAEEARADLELYFAVIESSRRGMEPVRLPLREKTAHERRMEQVFHSSMRALTKRTRTRRRR